MGKTYKEYYNEMENLPSSAIKRIARNSTGNKKLAAEDILRHQTIGYAIRENRKQRKRYPSVIDDLFRL